MYIVYVSENLHRKSRCEILIGGDDISNARVFQSLITFALVSASG